MAIIGTAIISLLILSSTYGNAALSLLVGVLYLPQTFIMSIAGIEFTPLRLLLVVALTRLIMKREYVTFKYNEVDRQMVIFQISIFTFHLLRHIVNPSPIDSIPYSCGKLIETNLVYFLFRCWFKGYETYINFIKKLAILLIPLAILMFVEVKTGLNHFSYIGGVPLYSTYREGAFRAQGSFRGPITAGSTGAALFPLFIGLFIDNKVRLYAVVGVIATISIVLCAHSSGALIGLATAIVALFMWHIRAKMSTVRWTIFASLVFLHIAMKAPVWFLIAKMSNIVGGGGWHRSNLIDQFLNNFRQWWLMGMPLEWTANWAATQLDSGHIDITNEFVSVGLKGGLVSLLLFIYLIKLIFKRAGLGIITTDEIFHKFILWSLGCSLIAHVFIQISVTYFDQSFVFWYLTIALIPSLTFLGSNSLNHKSKI